VQAVAEVGDTLRLAAPEAQVVAVLEAETVRVERALRRTLAEEAEARALALQAMEAQAALGSLS
jgi:hypothetical protein